MSATLSPADTVSISYESPVPPENRRQLGRRALNIALLLIPVVVVLAGAWHRRWMSDDAFINFRVIDNFAHGHGLVFNPGERVEAETSVLWVVLLAFFDRVTFGVPLEWWSVIFGMVGTAVGMLAAMRATVLLTASAGKRSVLIPVGALMVAVVSPVWDFVTSGLENGLGFAWIGISYWLLARCCATVEYSRRRLLTAALVMSLATLVRPDFGIMWVIEGIVLCIAVPQRTRKRVLLTVISLVAIPLAFEIFRMGYYATLGPNTALAKEASLTRWHEGFRYFNDLVLTYRLWVPFVAALLTLAFVTPWRDRRRTICLLAPLVAGLLHSVYIMRVGGDYMHGRMLLPSLFAVACPVMAVRLSKAVAVPVVVAVVWAFLCGHSLRWQYDLGTPDGFIVDERKFYVGSAANGNDKPAHPITLADYKNVPFVRLGHEAKQQATAHPQLFELIYHDSYYFDQTPLLANAHQKLVVVVGNVGMYGYAAGPNVFVADLGGLGDPISARTQIRHPRAKPGHEKDGRVAWFQGRFVAADPSDPDQAAAAQALSCPPLKGILESANAPLTPGRFLSNVTHAYSYWKVRFPGDPVLAEKQVCS